jgi:hypothetical protein
MQKLMPIIFTFLFTNFSFGQKSENEIFEASKGKWEMPIKIFYKMFDNEEMKRRTAYQFDSTLRILTDSAYDVKAVHKGEIILVHKDDSLRQLVLVKFGNYYVSYYPLQNLSVNKGNYIGSGQIIGSLSKDLDDNFNLEIHLSKKYDELCAKNWINWKTKPKNKNGHQP